MISTGTPDGQGNRCPVCGSAVHVEPSDPTGDAPCPYCGHLLWFTWQESADTVVVMPTRSVLLSEDLDRLIDRTPERRGARLVLDLGAIRYISSQALSKLIKLKKKVVGERGRLKVTNLHPDLLEVFRITRLDTVVDIET